MSRLWIIQIPYQWLVSVMPSPLVILFAVLDARAKLLAKSLFVIWALVAVCLIAAALLYGTIQQQRLVLLGMGLLILASLLILAIFPFVFGEDRSQHEHHENKKRADDARTHIELMAKARSNILRSWDTVRHGFTEWRDSQQAGDDDREEGQSDYHDDERNSRRDTGWGVKVNVGDVGVSVNVDVNVERHCHVNTEECTGR